jgi:hypothetical protein
MGAYPGQKISINPQSQWRVLIVFIYYIQVIMMGLGILCVLIVSIMLPHLWSIPEIRWIVTCFLIFCFYIVDLWIHISYLGWSFSSGEIHSYKQRWKVAWIIAMAWITILAFVLQIGSNLQTKKKPSIKIY